VRRFLEANKGACHDNEPFTQLLLWGEDPKIDENRTTPGDTIAEGCAGDFLSGFSPELSPSACTSCEDESNPTKLT